MHIKKLNKTAMLNIHKKHRPNRNFSGGETYMIRTFIFLFYFVFIIFNQINAQWVKTNGPYDGNIWCLAISPNGTGGTNLFAGTDDGVFISSDNGTSWRAASAGLSNTPVQALAALGTNLFTGSRDGIFLSTDNGTSWTWSSKGLSYSSVRAFVISPNAMGGTNLFAGTGGGGVFLSTNNGISWTPAGLTHVNIRSLALSSDGKGDTNLFAGTNGSGVFRSIDNGKSWTEVSTGLIYAGIPSLAVCSDGTDNNNLIAGTWGGIFFSTNYGTSWTEASTGLTFTYVYCLAVSPNGVGGTNIFAGTWDGVFLSIDNGSNWIAVNTGLTNTDVHSLVVFGNNLFVGTDGGVWKRSLPEMITSVNTLSTALQKHFNLRQNYPNPFNPVTTISFELPAKSFVTLKVFDGLGREVTTLISGELTAANYSHKWNAESLPSGVYFYRLQAGNYTATRKLFLLK
jgi:ligand-binding sensor domain-containing protein